MNDDAFEYAESRVSGPATALIIVSSLCGALLMLALAFNVWFLLSGVAGRVQQPGAMPKETQVAIRFAWELAMLATNVVILVGAVKMKGLRSLGLARLACILALIPCLGPCFVIGIPFGIWGLSVLSDPTVRRSFES